MTSRIKPQFKTWFEQNRDRFAGLLSFDEPLSKHTYYRIGGPASVFAVPKSESDIHWLQEGISNTQLPVFIMGMGSNLLVSDLGFPGLVIRANKINLELSEISSNSGVGRICTGTSVPVSTLLRRAAQEGWGGLEFLTGIPGAIGGVVTMNAGTHLGEAQKRLRKVEIFQLSQGGQAGVDLEKRVFEFEDLRFQYRKNLFLPKLSLIWAAEWEIEKRDPAQVKNEIDDVLVRRKATQPLDFPSCGSVFKNPKSSGMSAWQVIDQLGLRGHRIGDALISEKHSNFILNLGSAKAADVLALIQLVKSRAQSELGISLEEEVIYLSEKI